MDAVQRAVYVPLGTLAESALGFQIGAYALHTAREALKPIRELHKPSPRPVVPTLPAVGQHRGYIRPAIRCAGCQELWPCRTSRLVYPSDELAVTDEGR